MSATKNKEESIKNETSRHKVTQAFIVIVAGVLLILFLTGFFELLGVLNSVENSSFTTYIFFLFTSVMTAFFCSNFLDLVMRYTVTIHKRELRKINKQFDDEGG